MAFADNDPRRPTFEAHVKSLQEALGTTSSLNERHFLYHDIIEGLYRLSDHGAMAEYCFRELDEWPAVGERLREDDPGRELPPVIACRDRLLDFLFSKPDYDAVEQLVRVLAERRVLNDPSEADDLREMISSARLEDAIEQSLASADVAEARTRLSTLLALDPQSAGEIYKWFALRCLEAGQEHPALAAFQAALLSDPSLPGVKLKAARLAKKLGIVADLHPDHAREEGR